MKEQDLTSLEGIGEATAKKLEKVGIRTIEKLAITSYKLLIAIGIGEKTATKILAAARTRYGEHHKFVPGEVLLQEFETRQFLTSGTNELDRVLGGVGFEVQKVYELYGPVGAGKSNLLFQLVCTAFLPPEQGGLGTGTIFIDTEGTFSLSRVLQIAHRFGIDPETLTQHIIRSAPPTSDILIYLCERQLQKMASEIGARLICLDSLATHFRSEYGTDLQRLPERQQKASLLIHALKRVAKELNGVVILTNQVTSRPNLISKQRSWKHSMGYLIGHESQLRLMVRVKDNTTGLREIKVEKGIDLPPVSCEIYLGDLGFTDEPQRRIKRIRKQ